MGEKDPAALVDAVRGHPALPWLDRLHRDRVPPAAACTADPARPGASAYETWVREHLAEPIQVGRAARAIGVSERSLQRATRAHLGMSPIQLVHHIRVDHALHLLRTTDRSLHSITAAVGYRNVATLRALMRRHADTTPAAIRHTRG